MFDILENFVIAITICNKVAARQVRHDSGKIIGVSL